MIIMINFRIQLETISPEIGVDPPIRTVAPEDLLTRIESVPKRQTQMQNLNRPQRYGNMGCGEFKGGA